MHRLITNLTRLKQSSQSPFNAVYRARARRDFVRCVGGATVRSYYQQKEGSKKGTAEEER